MSKELELLQELEKHLRNTILEGEFVLLNTEIFMYDPPNYEEFRVESCYIGGLESILEELDEIRQQKEPLEN